MSVLSDEIDNDPTGKGYAAFLPDQPGHVVDLLNDKTETKLGLLDRTNLTLWAVGTKMLGTVKDLSEDKLSPLRDSALAIILVLQGASSGIDFTKQANVDTLNEWITEGKLTVEHRDLMLLMATHPASRAEVLGLPYVTEEMLRNR